MNFFGEWGVHDYPGDKDLWLLDNEPGIDMWGVVDDSGFVVVPCDNFVFDLASTKYVRGVWPQHWGRLAATFHDWGYHVSRTSEAELLEELSGWFDYMAWSRERSTAYIKALKTLPCVYWDRGFYVLTGLEGVPKCLRMIGYRVIRITGFFVWGRESANRTKYYRDTHLMESADVAL